MFDTKNILTSILSNAVCGREGKPKHDNIVLYVVLSFVS